MKIALFSRDIFSTEVFAPVPRLRLIDPLRLLGHELDFGFIGKYNGPAVYYPHVIAWADVIVVQRNFPGPDVEPICADILASGKPTVYETDDILWAVDHSVFQPFEPYIKKFAAAARLVTVSSAKLAEEFSVFNRRITVLPNYLNAQLWAAHVVDPRSRSARRVRIGYAGSELHRDDITAPWNVLAAIADKYAQVDLCFLGCRPEAMEGLPRASFHPGNYDYAQFPQRLAELQLDIGLAPLLPTRLNRCRSPIKFFDYALVGAACVASSDSPFDAVMRNGDTGYLCATPTQWFEALCALIENPRRRRSMALAAQAEVLRHWMLADHLHLWEAAYQSVLARS